MDNPALFEARWAKLQAAEDEKTNLVQDLIKHTRELETKLSDTQAKLEREHDVADMYHTREKEQKGHLHKLTQALAKMSYISVLVDGDCMLFNQDLVTAGEGGGRQAARLLRSAALAHVRSVRDLPANTEAVVRVYANIHGLSKAYADAGWIPTLAAFGTFANGFNKEDAYCDFVHAGDGKECADEKMRAIFRMSVDSCQCQHVIFGGSADNGYARLLGSYRGADKITLIEGPPFAKEISELAPSFSILKCTEVFSATTQIVSKVSTGRALQTRPATASNSYATALSNPSMLPPVDTNQSQRPTGAQAGVPLTSGLARNAAGQRIDVPLIYSGKAMKKVKARKLCKKWHIIGSCSYDTDRKPCVYEHSARVDENQLAALRGLARFSPCPKGLQCGDTSCILGHQCPKTNCTNGRDCNFGKKLHGVDTKIVSWD